MTTKHVPGPWYLRHDWNGSGTLEIGADPKGLALAELPNWGTDEIQASGQLMATSPELLDALVALVDCYTELSPHQPLSTQDVRRHRQVFCDAKRVIMKAKGEQA